MTQFSKVVRRSSIPIILGAIVAAIGCTPEPSLKPPTAEETVEAPTSPPPEVSAAPQTIEPAPPVTQTPPETPIEPATEPECESPQTQAEMNICAAISYQEADDELNRVYQNVTPLLTETQRDRLTDAQLAWIEFRDAECQFAGSLYEGGSIQPLIVAGCKEDLTQRRTDDLRAYLRQRPIAATSDSYEAADDRLNQVYQELLAEVSGDRVSQLETAELAWIEFRDRACDFEAELDNGERQNCTIRITQNRSDRLAEHLETNSM